MWNWLREIRKEELKEQERLAGERKEKRAQNRASYIYLSEETAEVTEEKKYPKEIRIRMERVSFEKETAALLELGLLEEELAAAVQERRGIMMRRIQEIMNE